MVRLEDLVIFISAADNGSLSAAARHLAVTPAVASVALKRLEKELGARLLARSTRSLRLTPEGERYLQYARNALDEMEAGRNALAHGRQAIGGSISLSMPSDLGRNVLAKWLDEFQALHPQVSLQVRLGDHVTDMFRRPIDVAVRYGTPDDSSLIALPLASENRRVLCAAPAYFARHGKPKSPADLAGHNCLRFSLSDIVHAQWTFHRDGSATTVAVRGDRFSDDSDLVRRWALDGRGIAYKSHIDVLRDLRAGRLEAALTDYLGEIAPLHLVCTHRLTLSPTVNALRELLQQRIDHYLTERR
jgi:DNA-binding transcriptional LysR family regulator